jgi:hypothetical protein
MPFWEAFRQPCPQSNLPWLHVSNGRVVDDRGNAVHLRGLNTAGLEYGDGVAKYTQARIQAFSNLFNMDLWRVPINVAWWNNNVFMPDGVTHYQDWIQQVIGWMEAAGNYVEIDPTNYAVLPPRGSGTYCYTFGNPPMLNGVHVTNCIIAQDTLNNPPWTDAQKITAATMFFQDFIPRYQNDPAMLYDALNEPYTFADEYGALNTMINVIRSLTNSLVFVYNGGLTNILNGTKPMYPQPNLVWDSHVYDDSLNNNTWQAKIARDETRYWPFVKSYKQAAAVGEWNAGITNDPNGFGVAIAQLALTQGISNSYYWADNLLNNDNKTVTAQGQIAQLTFQTIADGS